MPGLNGIILFRAGFDSFLRLKPGAVVIGRLHLETKARESSEPGRKTEIDNVEGHRRRCRNRKKVSFKREFFLDPANERRADFPTFFKRPLFAARHLKESF